MRQDRYENFSYLPYIAPSNLIFFNEIMMKNILNKWDRIETRSTHPEIALLSSLYIT